MRRRSTGYLVGRDTLTGKVVDERDSFTCNHCGRVFWITPYHSAADTGSYCARCDSYVCPRCAGQSCDVFMKKLERAISRASRRLIA